jgi:uncharacterized protein with GYD domain
LAKVEDNANRGSGDQNAHRSHFVRREYHVRFRAKAKIRKSTPGRTTMVTYVVLAKFTDQGAKTAKDSPKRAEAFRQMAQTFGVTVKDIFWTQGRYDIVTVVEAPDELSATALNLSLSALGNIRTESLRAFSSAEMMKIVAKML